MPDSSVQKALQHSHYIRSTNFQTEKELGCILKSTIWTNLFKRLWEKELYLMSYLITNLGCGGNPD
jgi:hypothetical protein